MIKDKNLIFDDEFILVESTDTYVMMRWETDLMKEHARKVCKNRGDILEIGFGMGISATFIQSFGVRSHTIVESHPMICQRLKDWSKDYPNVNIIFGDWFNLHWKINMKKYDGIFYDADCINHLNFKSKIVDVSLKEGGIFSYFYPSGGDIYQCGDRYHKELIKIEVPILKNNYHNSKECYVNWIEN